MKRYFSFILLTISLFSCNNDNRLDIPSVEERVAQSTEALKEQLTDPDFGWRLDYKPTSNAGIFLILLDFDEDGTVRIQSDVPDENGIFLDQTISYRIDQELDTELVLETYAVFHYLFEQNQNTFGGEFEFIYEGEQGNDLNFSSKTDLSSDVTNLVFTPASASDSEVISTEATVTLSQGNFQTSNLGGIGNFGVFNFHLQDQGYLLSVTFDLERRKLKVLGIAEGTDMSSVITNDNIVDIGRETTFSLSNERVVLDQPITASLGGNTFQIEEIPISSSAKFAESFCVGQQDSVVRFNATASDLGAFEANSSLFQVANAFEVSDDVYSINHIFIYDENDNSISDQIEAVFPEVVAFQWYHGVEIADSLFNGVGFVTVDAFNSVEFFLRGYDFTQNGNFLEITFNDENIITEDNPTQEQLDGLDQLTDQIFSGGAVYMLELSNIDGLFEFYNPCNKYKGFLF